MDPNALSSLSSVVGNIFNSMTDEQKQLVQNFDVSSVINTLPQMLNMAQSRPEVIQQALGSVMDTFGKNLTAPSDSAETLSVASRSDIDQTAMSISSSLASHSKKDKTVKKTADLRYPLTVSLEDLYMGKTKKLNVRCKRVSKTGQVKEEKIKISLLIKPGMHDGEEIRFIGMSDQLPGMKSGDIIITLHQDEHPFYERDGDDLVVVKNISLAEDYTPDFYLKYLDGSIIHVKSKGNDAMHNENGTRKVEGKGMPIIDDEGEVSGYGDLFIHFNIVLPDNLDEKSIEQLRTIFPPLTNEDTETDGFIVYENQIDSNTRVTSVTLNHLTKDDVEKMWNSDDEESEYESDDEEDTE